VTKTTGGKQLVTQLGKQNAEKVEKKRWIELRG